MRTRYSVGASAIAKTRVHCPTRRLLKLIPVVITTEQGSAAARPSTVAEKIEINVAGKYRVRVGSGFDGQALRRVLDVLERR